MKLVFRRSTVKKQIDRLKKKVRIRKNLSGSGERPRLVIFRSSKHIYASIVNDDTGTTLCSFSSLNVDDQKLSGKDMASLVGKELAKRALGAKIKTVVFDRNGYVYHGRVQSVANGAREGGLSF